MNKNGDIVIKSSKVTRGGVNCSRLVYTLEKNGQCFDLYYEVDNDYADYFCGTLVESVALVIEKANSLSAAAKHFFER